MKDKGLDAIRTVLTSEVKFIIGVIVFVIGGLGPFYSVRQDIALIQKDISIINTNHEAHIQDISENIKEIKQEQVEQQKQIIELQKQLLIALTNKK